MNGHKAKHVDIKKNPLVTPRYPPYVHAAHRHFEKETPLTFLPTSQTATLTAPVDLLGIMLPSDLVEGLESFEVTYRRRP